MKLLDWSSQETEVDVDIESDEYLSAFIEVRSGDEILIVVDKAGRVSRYDSSTDRMMDYYDGSYYLKLDGKLTDEYKSEAFQNRDNSYWFEHYDCESDEE